jgi:hypothetical protein
LRDKGDYFILCEDDNDTEDECECKDEDEDANDPRNKVMNE